MLAGVLSGACAYLCFVTQAPSFIFVIVSGACPLLIWLANMLPEHEKHSQRYQKKQLVDRFHAKYGKSANDECI
jgi:hypothetical protein